VSKLLRKSLGVPLLSLIMLSSTAFGYGRDELITTKSILSFQCGAAGGDAEFAVIPFEIVAKREGSVPSNQGRDYLVDYIIRRDDDGTEKNITSFSTYQVSVTIAQASNRKQNKKGRALPPSNSIQVRGSLILSKDPKLFNKFLVEGSSKLKFQISAVGESELASSATLWIDYLTLTVQLNREKATCRID
jgi:hypothetical protein